MRRVAGARPKRGVGEGGGGQAKERGTGETGRGGGGGCHRGWQGMLRFYCLPNKTWARLLVTPSSARVTRRALRQTWLCS